MRCAVFGCENYYQKKIDSKIPQLNFYLFPRKDPDLCEKWVEFCRRPKCFYVKNARICGDHFLAKDKERNIKYEMGFERAYCPKLKPGAVPCIYNEAYKIVDSKIKKLDSFPTVMWEEDSDYKQQLLCDLEEVNDPETDPLTTDEEKKNLNIPLVNLNGQQTANVNRLNAKAEQSKAPFKGIIAVLYPVDEAGKPLQGSLEQKFREEVANVNPDNPAKLPNENFLEQLRAYKREINKLKKSEESYKRTIKDLEHKIIKSNYEREHFEKKLKTIFTSNQIRQIKTGKRVIWSAEDMAKTVKLYKTSSAAFKLLKKQNYPFPSQKTVQAWIQTSRDEIKESATIDGQQNNKIQCLDPTFVDQIPAANVNYTDPTATQKQQMDEFLTFHSSTNDKSDYSISFEQYAIEGEDSGRLSVVEDHSYSLVVD